MRVPYLLLGLPARPPDQRPGPRLGPGLLGLSVSRGARLLRKGGRTGRPPTRLARRRHVGTGAPLQSGRVVRVPREDPGQGQERAEDLPDVDIVLGGALEDLHPAQTVSPERLVTLRGVRGCLGTLWTFEDIRGGILGIRKR